jgi:hypothetical protein
MTKKTNKQAPVEVLQALLAELRSLVAEVQAKLKLAKASSVRKRGPRKPGEVTKVPRKFTQAVMRTEIPRKHLKRQSLMRTVIP